MTAHRRPVTDALLASAAPRTAGFCLTNELRLAFRGGSGKRSPRASVSFLTDGRKPRLQRFHLGLPPGATPAGGALSHHAPRLRVSCVLARRCDRPGDWQRYGEEEVQRDGIKATTRGYFCRAIVSLWRLDRFGSCAPCCVGNVSADRAVG